MQTPTERIKHHFRCHVTTDQARPRRAAVTATPQATVRELSDDLDIDHATVGAALRMLRGAGYIDYPPYSRRARTILVPFATGVKVRKETKTAA